MAEFRHRIMIAATAATVIYDPLCPICGSGPAAIWAAGVTAPVAFCAERPWPYYGCVGTSAGNAQVRLVKGQRLAN